MDPHEPPSRNCYSMRLVRPFLAALRRYDTFPHEVLAPLEALEPDERLPIPQLLELLRGAIALTGDEDLGLKAAREIEVGDYGALEYAASSASTVREAFEVVQRYLGLVNDALTCTTERDGTGTSVRLESAIVLSRAATDFQSAAFYIAATRRQLVGPRGPVEVCFLHPEPADLREYQKTFPGEVLRFSAPFTGFVLDDALMDSPLESADPKLHALIREHAEQLLAELPHAQSFTQAVRSMLSEELSGGNPSAEHIAKRLHMSSRTLARRLEDEGTTFKALVDDLRKRLALRYVGGRDLDISEVAFLLGFSESSAFYRAFKRWTGQTPLAYRRAYRG